MDIDLEKIEEELMLDKVSSGDRPSILALGLAASQSLKLMKVAVLMVDARGRVRLMPIESVSVLKPPRIEDNELNEMEEEEAIETLVAQGDSEQTILEYLTRRKAAKG